jgi:hypothetical protein
MKKVIYCLVTIVLLASCKKQTENYSTVALNELYPIAVGKTFIYRLDSINSKNFGASLSTTSFHAKDSVESTFLDASGRTSFRIYRYLRDTLDAHEWKFAYTYYSTVTNDKIEIVENNLRFITLVKPVSYNTTWKGNSYINTTLSGNYYFLDNWDYYYQNIDNSFTCLYGNIPNTTTVMQQNTQVPEYGFDASVYNEKNYSIEVYAKGIGLIYKDFIHYIWQPTPTPAKYQDDSYGVRLNLIDYK